MFSILGFSVFFSYTACAPTHLYTLSLHDALPIYPHHLARRLLLRRQNGVDAGEAGEGEDCFLDRGAGGGARKRGESGQLLDRKSTRLNTSPSQISYAVFCLKKKKKEELQHARYLP